jgi:hypothetical protein
MNPNVMNLMKLEHKQMIPNWPAGFQNLRFVSELLFEFLRLSHFIDRNILNRGFQRTY